MVGLRRRFGRAGPALLTVRDSVQKRLTHRYQYPIDGWAGYGGLASQGWRIGCHTGAGVAANHLYFVPAPYRMQFLDQVPDAGRQIERNNR
jgi:hypothetical protein